MKWYLGNIVIVGLALLAAPAVAAQYNVSVTGTLTSQGTQFWPGLNTGIDDNLSVGSQIILTASFDSALLLPWRDTGYQFAGLYGFPTTGNSFFRIDAPGMTWQASDSEDDGAKFLGSEGLPGILISGDKVVGLIGWLSPAGSSARPEIGLTYSADYQTFKINAPRGLYGNRYNTPGFLGTWDFANSSVTDPPSPDAIAAVPEPATWAMFLIGFGAVGFTMRRRPALA